MCSLVKKSVLIYHYLTFLILTISNRINSKIRWQRDPGGACKRVCLPQYTWYPPSHTHTFIYSPGSHSCDGGYPPERLASVLKLRAGSRQLQLSSTLDFLWPRINRLHFYTFPAYLLCFIPFWKLKKKCSLARSCMHFDSTWLGLRSICAIFIIILYKCSVLLSQCFTIALY